MKKLHKKLRKVSEHIDLTHLNQVRHLKNLAMACDDFELAVQMRGFERVAEHELAESSKFIKPATKFTSLEKELSDAGYQIMENVPEDLIPSEEEAGISEEQKEEVSSILEKYNDFPEYHLSEEDKKFINSWAKQHRITLKEKKIKSLLDTLKTITESANTKVDNLVEKLKLEEPTLLVNSIKTPDGTILTSRRRHDFVCHEDRVTGTRYCIDGGDSYRRINPGGPYVDLSVYSDDPFEKIREGLERGNRGKNFDQPFKWVKLKDMSDAWLGELIPWLEDYQPNNKYKKYYLQEIEYRKEHNIKIEE